MFRFIDKLMRGDVINIRARKNTPPSEYHVLDGEVHTVRVEEVRNEKEYFVHCFDPSHDGLNWVNIHTDVDVWWDKEPASVKASKDGFLPVQRYKVLLANFVRSDEEKAEFQIEHEEIVLSRSFEKVIEAFPKTDLQYLMMINLDTKDRKIWEYDRGRWVVNPKNKEIIIHRWPKIETVCFTGHRPSKLPGSYNNLQHGGRVWIHSAIRSQLRELTPKVVITGGALGVDQEAFDIAWDLMEEGVIQEVWIYAPCRSQEAKWPAESQAKYRAQLAKAEAKGWVKYIHDGPYPGPSCLHRRNEAMVNAADAVIAIWDGSEGGTANCVEFANARRRKVFRINPKDAPAGPAKVAKPDRFDDDGPEDAAPEVRRSGLLYFKGSTRFPNESHAGGGYVVQDSTGKELFKYGFSLGIDTLMSADYRSLIAGLIQAKELGITDIEIRSSVGTILAQLEKVGCNDSDLMPLYNDALDALTYFRTVKFTKVHEGHGAVCLAEVEAKKAHN